LKENFLGKMQKEPTFHNQVEEAEEYQLHAGTRQTHQDALPAAAQVIASDRQSSEAIQHNVAIGAEQPPHENMPHFVKQDRYEDTPQPGQQQRHEPGPLATLPAKERAKKPEKRMDPNGNAEDPKADV
jgi:hypothetical protein